MDLFTLIDLVVRELYTRFWAYAAVYVLLTTAIVGIGGMREGRRRTVYVALLFLAPIPWWWMSRWVLGVESVSAVPPDTARWAGLVYVAVFGLALHGLYTAVTFHARGAEVRSKLVALYPPLWALLPVSWQVAEMTDELFSSQYASCRPLIVYFLLQLGVGGLLLAVGRTLNTGGRP